jgi:hypothetical protein
MRRKVTAITLACSSRSRAQVMRSRVGNDRPGNSDCHGNGHPAPGENGLFR